MGSISSRRGFTIVELLIVIVVIGILAAVTIVAFNGVQQRAKTTVITNSVDQWEKIIRSEIVTQGSLASMNTNTSSTCLGGSASDFPADGIFGAGECVVVTDASGGRLLSVNYDANSYTGWTTSRQNGKLPTTQFKLDASTVIHARGIWIFSYDPNSKVVVIVWVPNVNGSCGRGQVLNQGSQALGSLDGGYCSLNIAY